MDKATSNQNETLDFAEYISKFCPCRDSRRRRNERVMIPLRAIADAPLMLFHLGRKGLYPSWWHVEEHADGLIMMVLDIREFPDVIQERVPNAIVDLKEEASVQAEK